MTFDIVDYRKIAHKMHFYSSKTCVFQIFVVLLHSQKLKQHEYGSSSKTKFRF